MVCVITARGEDVKHVWLQCGKSERGKYNRERVDMIKGMKVLRLKEMSVGSVSIEDYWRNIWRQLDWEKEYNDDDGL